MQYRCSRHARCLALLTGAREMFEWALSLHHCMYVSLSAHVSQLSIRPSVLVSDFGTYAGFDVADQFNITLVSPTRTHAHLLSFLPCYALQLAVLSVGSSIAPFQMATDAAKGAVQIIILFADRREVI